MEYCNAPVPPVAIAVMVPSLNPQEAGEEVAVSAGPGKFKTVTGNVFIQPFISRTYKVYVPAATALNTLLAWYTVPLIEYCNAPVPPLAVAVMVPLFKPQAALIIAAVNTCGPAVLATTTCFAVRHPFTSFTVTV